MVASLPITWAATIVTDSQMTGLTLPGMIDEPGCTAGIAISAMPARGPQPSRRMSLAILYSDDRDGAERAARRDHGVERRLRR